MKWQPIESAPKDGSWILLNGGHSQYCEDNSAISAFWYSHPDGRNGWFFAKWDGQWQAEYLNPTCWMIGPPSPPAIYGHPFKDRPWIQHQSGFCPVPFETLVEVQFSNGAKSQAPELAGSWPWDATDDTCGIAAYRVVE